MSEERLNSLLLVWQEQHLQGRDVPAADLCRDCPELAEELSKRIGALRQMNRLMQTGPEAAVLDAIPGEEQTTVGGDAAPAIPNRPDESWSASSALPRSVPGYEILGELGRGGMGVVYKARQVKANRLVALKMILSGGHASEDDLARFRTEAEAVARLQHPGIVQIYEVNEHESLPYFSMEYVEGGSLEKDLAGTPMPPKAAARLVEQLAQAIQTAHEHQVIHRDLKPANVLLSADGRTKITDFGLAKKLDVTGKTQTGAIMGTPSYMAPEQAGGKSKAIGPPADIYALGAILYECLTGRPPFEAANPVDVILKVIADEPVSPRQLRAKVPADLEAICLKCLRKEPEQRYASAADLAEDLRRFRAGEPVTARPMGKLERARRWSRRNKALASLMTAVALVLLAGTALSSYFAVRAIQRAEEAEAERDRAKFQKLRAETARFAIQIDSALRAWERHDVTEAERLLGEVEEPFQRTWEHRHLRSLCRRKPILLLGHGGQITSVAFNPNGQRLASGSIDGTVKVWDAATGQEIRTLKGHTSPVFSVAFSPDGTRIVSGSWVGMVKVWDAATGQEKLSLTGNIYDVISLAISIDGKRILSGSRDGTLKVWDAATGKEKLTLKGHSGVVSSVAFSSDGRRIASGSWDGMVKAWDAATGEEKVTLKGHSGVVSSVAFSPDGQRLVSGSEDRTVKVWDAATGQEKLSLQGHGAQINSVAFSDDGKRITSGSRDGTVKVWDALTGHAQLTLKGHIGIVSSVAFSSDGKRIASGGSQDRTVRVWDSAVGQEQFSLKGHSGVVSSVAFSSDGRRIASGSEDRTVKVWDAATGQEKLSLKGHTDRVTSVAFGPDGRRIASGSIDRTVKVWDVATRREKLSLEGHTDWVTTGAFSPDGKRLVSGSGNATVKVWDAASGQELLSIKAHRRGVTSVAFSPDGQRLVSGSGDRTVKVWDAATGQEQLCLQGHDDQVTSVAFSPGSNRIASGSRDGRVKVWDAQSGTSPFPLKEQMRTVSSVTFSPDGKRIAAGGEGKTPGSGEVHLWDADTGQHLLTLKGHTGLVTSVAFSPDGKYIVSGSADKTVKVWEAPDVP
jgi:WD40 repeat protein/tRNA A-37 threonylcarbamoyl transferase component Bud32